jgi:hypothetical protein
VQARWNGPSNICGTTPRRADSQYTIGDQSGRAVTAETLTGQHAAQRPARPDARRSVAGNPHLAQAWMAGAARQTLTHADVRKLPACAYWYNI